MEIGSFNLSSDLYEEMWRACAGPLVHLPHVGETVFYFPQGHLEQVAALTNEKLNETLPYYDLPSKIQCKVVNICLLAAETDEVYAQITLFPEHTQDYVYKPDAIFPKHPEPIVKSIYKVLTTTDIRNTLHVRQKDANECFPPLDMTQETPSQELVARDLHGISWHFKHKFTGNPKRHVLTTGWKRFVTKKRLISGDSIIFIRGENGELRVGIRHLSSQRRQQAPNSYLASGQTTDLLMVLATAWQAVSTRSLFTVFYRPNLGSGPFIVGVNRYMECAKNLCSIGMRFSMRFEGEDHLQRRHTGSIIEVEDISNCWRDSKWRCLKVKWDDLATITRPERVSPWEIDPVDLNKDQRYGKLSQAKKTRQPKPIHHSSAEENMMNSTPNFPNEQNWCLESAVQPIQQQEHTQNWLFDPLISSQQYWIQNVGQPNWNSLQTSNIHTGPILSNGDNWIQQMLHEEPLQMDEIVCNQFPTLSPTIHFSELHGERVSTLNSEESVQGEPRKRKATSVGDAESDNGKESGFDDRQVKCRIELSQGGANSNSNGTHYSSASEGEPSTGKCSQDSTMVEDTENASDRPFVYRAWDRISCFLLHHLKNYVAK